MPRNAATQNNNTENMEQQVPFKVTITEHNPERGVLANADVNVAGIMTIRNVKIKQDLEGGGQVIIEEAPDLGQLFGVCRHMGEDLLGHPLHMVDLPGDLCILNAVVEAAHLGDGPVPLGHEGVHLRVSGRHRLAGRLRLRVGQHQHPVAEQAPRRPKHRDGEPRQKEEVPQGIHRAQKRPHDPQRRRQVQRDGGFFHDLRHRHSLHPRGSAPVGFIVPPARRECQEHVDFAGKTH